MEILPIVGILQLARLVANVRELVSGYPNGFAFFLSWLAPVWTIGKPFKIAMITLNFNLLHYQAHMILVFTLAKKRKFNSLVS